MKKRSLFNLSHENKLSFQMGQLVPILNLEVLPGDTFTGKSDALIRLAPQLAPIMADVSVFTHYFFVPNRILWDNGKSDCWETFITGGKTGNETPSKPTITFEEVSNNSLADYFGLPNIVKGTNTPITVDALPFRAYNMIYNEWYRDENLQNEVPFSLAGGVDTTTSTTLLNRNWEKDYFTSALPWTQRGDGASVPLVGSIPLSSSDAPVLGNGTTLGLVQGNAGYGAYVVEDNLFTGIQSAYGVPISANVSDSTRLGQGSSVGVTLDSTKSGLKADLSNVTAELSQSSNIDIDISDLREASAVQRWLEKSARFGYRYIEQILSFFGVRSPDSRLQRPEYIGGGRSPILFSEVLQTSSSTDDSAQGNMSGHGFSAFRSHRFRYFSTEHGWIIGIMSILPRTNYQQGIARKWTRQSRYDYFFPEFQNIGEQEVLNKELYAGTPNDNEIFGYQQRYAEYKMIPSEVHGDFRSNLNYWHMGRIFSNAPKLNSQFVTADPTTRIFAIEEPGVDNIYAQIAHHIIAKRPMAKYSKPSLR